MPLLTLRNAELAYGLHPLLDRATAVDRGRRAHRADRPQRHRQVLAAESHRRAWRRSTTASSPRSDGLRVVLVEQEPELPPARHGARQPGRARPSSMQIHDERERWRIEARLDEFLHRLDVAAERAPETHFRRRAQARRARARAGARAGPAAARRADQPSRHRRHHALEELLLKGPACIVITHDRAFLDRVVTRIVELDRGLLRSYPGNFAAYEARKSEQLAAEEVANRKFDKFWAQEEVWIRSGIEARRTRNEGRVRRLESLRVERAARRERLGNVKLTLDAGERSGKLVAELTDVAKRFGERPIVRDLSHARHARRPSRA